MSDWAWYTQCSCQCDTVSVCLCDRECWTDVKRASVINITQHCWCQQRTVMSCNTSVDESDCMLVSWTARSTVFALCSLHLYLDTHSHKFYCNVWGYMCGPQQAYNNWPLTGRSRVTGQLALITINSWRHWNLQVSKRKTLYYTNLFST